jgi:hypothetical protein
MTPWRIDWQRLATFRANNAFTHGFGAIYGHTLFCGKTVKR